MSGTQKVVLDRQRPRTKLREWLTGLFKKRAAVKLDGYERRYLPHVLGSVQAPCYICAPVWARIQNLLVGSDSSTCRRLGVDGYGLHVSCLMARIYRQFNEDVFLPHGSVHGE